MLIIRYGMRIFCLFAVTLLLTSLSYAQQPTPAPSAKAEALTNADVLKMVEAKLTDDLIIGKIKSSPSDFDTSINAILKLKAAGASDAVIHGMVEAGPAARPVLKEAAAKEPAPDPNDPKSPHASGLYWKPTSEADNRVMKLEASTYSQGKAGPGFFKMTWKIVIKGDRAALRITGPAPEFWFYFATGGEAFASSGPSNPDDFVLARLERKSKERELAVGQGGMTGMKAGVRSQDTIALESKQVAPGIYQARASRPLEPGEYAFVRAGVTMESASSGKLFDFGIDRAK